MPEPYVAQQELVMVDDGDEAVTADRTGVERRGGKGRRLLKVREVATILNVSLSTAYGLCERRQLPHLRVGAGRGGIRIDCADLEQFMQAAKVTETGATVRTRSAAGRPFRHLDGDRLRRAWPQQDEESP